MEEKAMSLVRFSRNYPSLFDRFFENDLFNWSNQNFSSTNTTLPSVNIKEGKENFEVEVAAPGLNKEDFKIELNRELLTISSEKKVENETKEEDCYTCREFSYQSFSRSFTLPNIADGEKIMAKYENGILKVTIPKKEEVISKQSRMIDIM
jgi:HSP20 family protein